MSINHWATSRLARAALATSLVLCHAILPAQAQAPREPGHRLDSGLFTLFGGRELAISVTEVGDPEASSFVRVRVLDRRERVLLEADRRLKRGQPVLVVMPLSDRIDRALVRVSIQIVGMPGRLAAPLVGVEDIDPASRTLVVRGLCAPPGGRSDPVEAICPGWEVTDITAPE